MSFFENTRKPVGLGGKIMVAMMNVGHSAVARWGLQFIELAPDAKVLDCGCGGGANIKRLLKKCPEGIVKGIDYSPVSVEKSKKVNEAAIAEGRCTVLQGSVADMIFAGDWFDAVSLFIMNLHRVRRRSLPSGTVLRTSCPPCAMWTMRPWSCSTQGWCGRPPAWTAAGATIPSAAIRTRM